MPLGEADNPFGGLELNSQTAGASTPPAQPLENLVAEEEAAKNQRLAGEAAHRTAEEPEKTRAEILLSVQTEWEFCGLEPCDSNAELATDILTEYQTVLQVDDPNYVVGETETKADLIDIVARGVSRQERRGSRQAEEAKTSAAEMAETAAVEEEALETKDEAGEVNESAQRYVEWKNQFNGDFVALVNDAASMPVGEPPNSELLAERAKLIQFQQIIAIADRVPADAAIVRQRINQIDMSQGVPDPVGFARSFLFDGPQSHLKSGVSDATQNAIAETLGIERPAVDVTTGSEMTDVFENGIGTRMVRDPETGELREEPVFLEPGEFKDINDGQSIGLTESGDRAMRFDEEVGSFTVILPDNATSEDMVMYGLAGQMMSQLHDVNMAEMMYPGRNLMERGGGVLDIRMPDDFNRTQRLCQIFFGEFSGYDGSLLGQSDLDRIPYLMQFQNAKGDAVIGDVNPEQMRADYQRQGIIDDGGNFDWDLFATMVEANRNGLYVSEQHYGRNAQAAQ